MTPRRTALLLVALLLLATGASAARATAGTGAAFRDVAGTARFASESGGPVPAGAVTIPNWSSSYVDPTNGLAYRYTMVGTSPLAGPATTAVHTLIVPVDLTFAGGGSLLGSSRVSAALASPVFQAALFAGGMTTQYANAIQKAMFWSRGGSAPGYNVLLANDGVAAPLALAVPQNQGHDLVGSVSGRHFAEVSDSWLSERLHNYLGALHVPSTVLPIFLSDSVFLTLGKATCCVLGFHGASSNAGSNGKAQVSTFLYASYSDSGIFSSPLIADVHSLSHEVSEWMADPFVTNAVRPWSVPSAPFYGCSSLLETGDPLVGVGFPVPMPNGLVYHPQDEAYLPWFAHESPSSALDGRYTYLGTFSSASPSC